MSWTTKIPGCFGSVDLIFANHPLDHQRACDMLKDAISQQVSTADFRKEIKDFLVQKGAGAAHIKQQMIRVMSIKTYLS